MKPLLMFLVLGICATAFAQAPSGEEQAPEPPPQAEEQGAGEASDDPEGGPGTDSAADSVEETLPPAPPDPIDPAEEEFQPDEEISEDYPVPLPSDI